MSPFIIKNVLLALYLSSQKVIEIFQDWKCFWMNTRDSTLNVKKTLFPKNHSSLLASVLWTHLGVYWTPDGRELNHVIELETNYWNINCNRYGRILISGLIACVQSRNETRYMCSYFVKVSKCESFLAQNCVAAAVFPISSSLFDPFDANKEIDGCRFSLLDGKIYLGIAWMRVEAYPCPCIYVICSTNCILHTSPPPYRAWLVGFLYIIK